ncbi:MAG: PilZ domain-containing protein [Sulfuricaulis sp.]|nr:PilZ domain-containing protein [Sulfuricaulis sp.]
MPAKQLKLKPEERRRARREVLRHKPQGVLQIFTRFINLDVIQIHDVSPFGLCLLLNHSIDRDAPIKFKYVRKGIQIEVSGTVVWKKPVQLSDSCSIGTYGFWVGIFLHPSDIDANFALYQALMEGAKPETRSRGKTAAVLRKRLATTDSPNMKCVSRRPGG